MTSYLLSNQMKRSAILQCRCATMATKQTGEAPSRRRQQSPFPVTTLPAISVRLESQTAPGLRTSNIAKCVVTYIVKPPRLLHCQRPRHRPVADAEGAEGALGHRLRVVAGEFLLELFISRREIRLADCFGELKASHDCIY